MSLIIVVACGGEGGESSAPASTTGTPAPDAITASPRQQPVTSLELPVRVAVTLPVFAEFVRQAGGDNVEVLSLVPEGVDPQTYDFTAQDIERFAGVRFFYGNSLGLDDHLLDTIEEYRDENAFVIPFGPNVRSPTMVGEYASEARDEPHLWLDPDVAAGYVAIIADEFVIYDGINRSFYNERFRTSVDVLTDFADELAGMLIAIPDGRRKLIARSNAIDHIVRRFDLDLIGTTSEGGSSETTEQAIQRLAQLVDDEDVPAVFGEAGHDNIVMEEVASRAGVDLCILFTDVALSAPMTYEELMRANVTELIRCLGE